MPKIRGIKPELIADAQFAGLFMGEGHLDLCKSARGRSLCPRVRMGLRDDDLPLLEWCRERFGGSLTARPALRAVTWQLTGSAAVGEVLSVLGECRLPAKKFREVALMREAVALVPTRGQHVTDEAVFRLHAIKAELIRLRAYEGVA